MALANVPHMGDKPIFSRGVLWAMVSGVAACQVFSGPEMDFGSIANSGGIIEAAATVDGALTSLKPEARQTPSLPAPDMPPPWMLQARVEALFDAWPLSDPAYSGPAIDAAQIAPETRLSPYLDDTLSQSVTFAGRYGVILAPCGTACQDIRLIDMETGALVKGPAASVGARWRKDSRLIIVNDPYVLGGFAPTDIAERMWSQCFILERGGFTQIPCSLREDME